MTARYLRLVAAIGILAFGCVTISCAKATITAHRDYAENEQLPKPERIIVYNFAATPEDVPADDAIIGLYETPTRPLTSDEVAIGRKLGIEIAEELVEEIRGLGMSAERSSRGLIPGPGDLVIKGALVTIDEGDRLKRVLIGFGAGAGKLNTLIEIYYITNEGSRPLVSEEIKATGGKMPGMLFAVPAAVLAGPVGLSPAAASATGPSATVGEATATSGSVNVTKELGPESLRAAAKKTAKEIAKTVSQIFARHRWSPGKN